MSLFRKKVGIDLGTTYTLVYLPQKGIVLNEPSVVAISTHDKRVLAVGDEAKEMLGRTPDTIVARRPLKEGVIADYQITEQMLKYFINKAVGGVRFMRPEVLVAVPGGITSTEKRAVIDATLAAGAKVAHIILEPVAAAIGANIPIGSASGHMIIDIGGGTCEIAVLSLGGIVAKTSIRVGGTKLDLSLMEFIRKKYGLAIGERTAEEVKINIGTALSLDEKLVMEIKGRDMISGLPKSIQITSEDTVEALRDDLQGIINAIKSVLNNTPPELSADIMEKGMILSGGTSQLRNLERLVERATGVPTYMADEPLLCVAKGTGIVLDNLDAYKRSVSAIR